MEINIRIRGVLVHGVNQNFGPSLVPLREGVIRHWVSPLELILIYLCQFWLLQRVRIIMQDVGYARSALQGGGVTLDEDAVRWEANLGNNERQQVQRKRR
jgi:hypothetical protein